MAAMGLRISCAREVAMEPSNPKRWASSEGNGHRPGQGKPERPKSHQGTQGHRLQQHIAQSRAFTNQGQFRSRIDVGGHGFRAGIRSSKALELHGNAEKLAGMTARNSAWKEWASRMKSVLLLAEIPSVPS